MGSSDGMDALLKIAGTQGGFFTARQAVRAGVRGANHSYHLRAGNWERHWRSVYRLAWFPLPDDWQYCLWATWSRNRRSELAGVYSYQTALVLFDLTDAQPDKIHMTVPRTFRRTSVPPAVLRFHTAHLAEDDCEERQGYRVTRPRRTIADLARDPGTPSDMLAQAVSQALSRGLLTHPDHRALLEDPQVGTSLRTVSGTA